MAAITSNGNTLNLAAYCSGDFGPGISDQLIANVQESGLTTIILWAMHIGRPSIPGQQYGDLVFNSGDIRIVSEGTFNPGNDSAIGQWPNDIAQLKQNGSKVSKIFVSIGGWGVEDFESIQYMLNHGMADVLKQNFQALRDAFTMDGQCLINGIDFDNEEYVSSSTIVDFAEILFSIGFEVTFCPYVAPTEWQGYMQTLWDKGYQVSWWNLQCYSGGNGNLSNLQPWIDALSAVVGDGQGAAYLVPGLAVQGATDSNPQQCPTGEGGMCQSFASVSNLGLAGGFIWKYDSILSNTQPCSGSISLPSAADYSKAIEQGLGNNCG